MPTPRLAAALTRPIRWDLIGEQYDQMIKYATAIQSGTASTEAILRRFTKANANHPTYQAMIELGRAKKGVVAVLIDRLTVRSVALKVLTMPARDRMHALQVLEVVSQRKSPRPTSLSVHPRGDQQPNEPIR